MTFAMGGVPHAGPQQVPWKAEQEAKALLLLLLLFSSSVMSNSATPWTAACQTSLSFTISQRWLKTHVH